MEQFIKDLDVSKTNENVKAQLFIDGYKQGGFTKSNYICPTCKNENVYTDGSSWACFSCTSYGANIELKKKIETDGEAKNDKNDNITTSGQSNAQHKAETKKKGRPLNEKLVRDNTSQKGLLPTKTRATFIIDVDLQDRIKHYAKINERTVSSVVNDALNSYLNKDLDV